ncbi:hypothetical protein GJAV_G00207400 [Gymnothorax javanicus]|nr:hypothetical protein GJAV_G00207400 [Gymnothorax javanicus]
MAAAAGQGEIVFEFASTCMGGEQQLDNLAFPAVIVEQVPGSHVLEYSGLSCEQTASDVLQPVSMEMAKELVEREEDDSTTVEASNVNGNGDTIEVAEALLHMESPDLSHERHVNDEFMQPASSPMISMSHSANEFPHAHIQRDSVAEGVTDIPKKKVAVRKRARSPSPTVEFTVKKKYREGKGHQLYLWEFLMALLQDESTCPKYIKWTHQEKGIFKLVDSKAVSRLWGRHKNKPDMNYETMGRALRYYYQRGILAKVEGQRLVYQFTELAKSQVDADWDNQLGERDHSLEEQAMLDNSSPPHPARKPSNRGEGGGKQRVRRAEKHTGSNAAHPNAVLRPLGGDIGCTNKAEKPLGLIQQEHLPIISAEMLRTLQNIQSLQPGQTGSVFRTVQLLENLQNAQEQKTTAEPSLEGMPLESLRFSAVETAASLQTVAEDQSQQPIILQAVPLTATIDGQDVSVTASLPRYFLQTDPSTQTVTLVMETVPCSEVAGQEEVCTEAPVLPTLPSPSEGGATSVVTLPGGGQRVVTQPPGTVIASVVTAPESKRAVPEDVEELDLERHPDMKLEQFSVVVFNDSWVGHDLNPKEQES